MLRRQPIDHGHHVESADQDVGTRQIVAQQQLHHLGRHRQRQSLRRQGLGEDVGMTCVGVGPEQAGLLLARPMGVEPR